MKYDFETSINRKDQGASKWEIVSKKAIDEGFIPLSVADMEFVNAPEIVEGLKKHLDETILGYTGPSDAYYNAIITYLKKHHNIPASKENIAITPGVVNALFYAIKAFCKEGDGVLIMTPVYYPFTRVIKENKCQVIDNPLIYENNAYTIDFVDLEAKLSLSNVKMMILCSPHNPVGRVWTKEELIKIADLCLKYNVYLVSDEIHMDIIMPNITFTSLAAIDSKYLDNLMVCTSCSKTFNLAGLKVSNSIIYNSDKYNIYSKVLTSNHISSLNNIAYKALEIAYTKCDDWKDELLEVINENRIYLKTFILNKLPKIKVIELEGTYLQWLDLTAYNLDEKALEKLMVENYLYFDEGYLFGVAGVGFERVNLACPKAKLEIVMHKLYEVLNKI